MMLCGQGFNYRIHVSHLVEFEKGYLGPWHLQRLHEYGWQIHLSFMQLLLQCLQLLCCRSFPGTCLQSCHRCLSFHLHNSKLKCQATAQLCAKGSNAADPASSVLCSALLYLALQITSHLPRQKKET